LQEENNNNNYVNANITDIKAKIHQKADRVNAAPELGFYFPASMPGFYGVFFLKFLIQ